jgi:hypothetical protein
MKGTHAQHHLDFHALPSMLGDRKTVILRGGAPWGFRLSGGGHTPIYIAKVDFLLS